MTRQRPGLRQSPATLRRHAYGEKTEADYLCPSLAKSGFASQAGGDVVAPAFFRSRRSDVGVRLLSVECWLGFSGSSCVWCISQSFKFQVSTFSFFLRSLLFKSGSGIRTDSRHSRKTFPAPCRSEKALTRISPTLANSNSKYFPAALWAINYQLWTINLSAIPYASVV